MRRIRKIKLISTGGASLAELAEAVLCRVRGEFPESTDEECAARARKESEARAKYRGDTFMPLLKKCGRDLLDLLAPYGARLDGGVREKIVVGVAALANLNVRNCLHYGNTKALAALDRARVANQLHNIPANARQQLAESVLEWVNVDLMREVCESAETEAIPIDQLPWNEVCDAIVPFTATCQPTPLRARQCWCGYWLEVGIWQVTVWQCPFCGEPAPPPAPRPSTLLWRRNPLLPVLQIAALPPATANALNVKAVRNRWQKLWGEANPDEDLDQAAVDDDLAPEEGDLDDGEGEYDE